MKTKLISLGIIILLKATFCLGQSIDTFSVWRVDYSYWEHDYAPYYNIYKDYIEGDTIIDSLVYFKVYHTGYSYFDQGPNPTYSYYSHDLHGYLREEGNKWYTSDGFNDLLLFDFTLNVGDTVISAFSPSMGDPITVSEIDSIIIGSAYKKRFHLNNMGAEYIIEGIGATTGLFENMGCFEWWSELVCFAKNGISLWGASTEDCELNVAINEKKSFDQAFHVFPNPASDKLIVLLPQGCQSASIKLFDSFGHLVQLNYVIELEKVEIQVEGISPGIYILHMDDGVNIYRTKVLKM